MQPGSPAARQLGHVRDEAIVVVTPSDDHFIACIHRRTLAHICEQYAGPVMFASARPLSTRFSVECSFPLAIGLFGERPAYERRCRVSVNESDFLSEFSLRDRLAGK